MASIAELVFLPIFALIIFSFALMGIALTPEASARFEHVTNQGLSETMIQSATSTMFKERNVDGITNYKAMSYKLCKGSGNTPVSSHLITPPSRGITEVLGHMKIRFVDIPSQCSSASSFTELDLFGTETPGKVNYYYEKKIPVIGGNVTDMRVEYEVE